ncbi:unnamed protein product [Coffea canephora]|uniref:Uncharacterized protein n=1 Tax=Coffea canephora TaxID=49390 RepID=A0A068VAZ0_COFCA|nr:unnamed protein product [Coffea canephora]
MLVPLLLNFFFFFFDELICLLLFTNLRVSIRGARNVLFPFYYVSYNHCVLVQELYIQLQFSILCIVSIKLFKSLFF